MEIRNSPLELHSPAGCIWPFKVLINTGNNLSGGFTITLQSLGFEDKTNKTYSVQGRDHNAYLDFFFGMSKDFNLRTPRNRQVNTAPPSFSANYRVVLTENLDENMFFGYGDPAILRTQLREETAYYVISTSNDAPNSFPIIRSADLIEWQFCGYAFTNGNKPTWAAEGENIADYWAPEMHQVGNEFRLYFVARDKISRELCLGMARSANPEGPYYAQTSPLLTGNVIDPHVFVEDADNVYLLWKEDNNDVWPQKLTAFLYEHPEFIAHLFEDANDQRTASLMVTLWPWAKELPAMERFFVLQLLIEAVIERYVDFQHQLKVLKDTQPDFTDAVSDILAFMKTPMFMQKLSADGTALVDEKTKILENDLEWEAHLIEGMWITEHAGKFYLFYAGNDFSTDKYGIGYAVADKLSGPYLKSSHQLLQSTAEWWAPGHPSVVKTDDGRILMFLHAYPPGKAGYKKFRALLEVPLLLKDYKVSIGT